MKIFKRKNINTDIDKNFGKIDKIYKKNISYNLTYNSKATFLYPKSYSELNIILTYFQKNKKKVIIKTGGCSYGDKSNLQTSNFIISLSKLNKILNFDNKKFITAQAGISLFDLLLYLRKKNFMFYNIPGGRSVSLGGAISGNVHGRPSNENFANFGDNIVSLKVMFEDSRIKTIDKNNKIFFNIIGGLGVIAIILEAKIKIFKIKHDSFEQISTIIKSEEEFRNYEKNISNCYGYINHFNINKFEGFFYHFKPSKNFEKSKIINLKKNSLFKLANNFKLPYLFSFFINRFSLFIFYLLLFFLLKNIKLLTKSKLLNYEKSIYFSDFNQFLPLYFRCGMIEIMFSVQTSKFFHLVKILKKSFLKYNIYPFFFIIKKMNISCNKYFFNFPINTFSISISFSKRNYNNNRKFFTILYKILDENNCNLYLTKDEIFINNINYLNKKNSTIRNHFFKSKLLSSDFKEKIIRYFKY